MERSETLRITATGDHEKKQKRNSKKSIHPGNAEMSATEKLKEGITIARHFRLPVLVGAVSLRSPVMNFPLQLSFKIIALAPQIYVSDANGETVCYVRQKMLKLREAIDVYTDKKKTQKVAEIKADKILDFSATYHFYDSSGNQFGAIARKGLRSIWKAHYDILEGEDITMSIHEEKPWVKVIDGLVDGIPVVGAFTGFFLHPSYIVSRADSNEELLRIKKQRAFFESRFDIEKLSDFPEDDELRMVLATVMMVLLEKDRG